MHNFILSLFLFRILSSELAGLGQLQ